MHHPFFHRVSWLLGLGATLLSACAQTVPPQPACPPAAQSAAAVRVMVVFDRATVGGAPETLQRLRAHGQACVSHLSSVSPTVHVYAFAGIADVAALRQNLRTWAAVRDVVPDDKARAQNPR